MPQIDGGMSSSVMKKHLKLIFLVLVTGSRLVVQGQYICKAKLNIAWYSGRSNLVFIHGRTNTTTYVDHLEEALTSHLHRLRHIISYTIALHGRILYLHMIGYLIIVLDAWIAIRPLARIKMLLRVSDHG